MTDIQDNIMRTPRDSSFSEGPSFERKRKEIMQNIVVTDKNNEYFEKLYDDLKQNENQAKEEHNSQIISLNKKIAKLEEELEETKKETAALKEKNLFLSDKSEFSEILAFYEEEIRKIKVHTIENLNAYITHTTKLLSKSREAAWIEILEKLRKKLNFSTEELHRLKSKERQLEARSIFFKKYCFKAEEKLNRFSKMSFKSKEWTDKMTQLSNENSKKDSEIENLKFTLKKSENEIFYMRKKNKRLENFYDEMAPIVKTDWETLKLEAEANNLKNLESVRNEEENFMDSIDTLIDYWKQLSRKVKLANIKNESFSKLLVEIKEYVSKLIKRNGSLTFNQYHIVNSCCFLNDKEIQKKIKHKVDLSTQMEEIKLVCAKMTKEYKPDIYFLLIPARSL